MFSRNFMVNLLFANPGDTYYTEGMLQFHDLNEYIWYDIRKNNSFDSVFFLHNQNEIFEVSQMEDRSQDIFSPGLFSSKVKQFKTWMIDRLRDKKNRTAIVCPLSDFCELMGTKDWAPLLEALQELASSGAYHGILILTAPPYVENIRPYILGSPVFTGRTMRNGSISLCPPVTKMRNDPDGNHSFDSLQDTMQDACIFLNQFNDRSVEAIFNQVVIRQGHKITVNPLLTEDHLKQVLNSGKYGFRPLTELFPGAPIGMSFRELYRLLSDPENWKRLEKASVENPIYEAYDSASTPIFYRNHVLKHCLNLELPPKELCEEGMKEFVRFKKELLVVKNKPLNQVVLDRLEILYKEYNDHKRHECDQQILRLLLLVLRFCATNLYAEFRSKAESTVMKITDGIRNYLKIWQVCEKLANDIKAAKFTTTNVEAAKLQHTLRMQMEQKQAHYRDKLQILEQVIYTLSASIQIEKYDTAILEEAIRELSEFESYSTTAQAPQQAPQPEPVEQVPPEEEFNIIPADYIDCPI